MGRDNFLKEFEDLENQNDGSKEYFRKYRKHYRESRTGRNNSDYKERSLHDEIQLRLKFSENFYEQNPESRGAISALARIGIDYALEKGIPSLMKDSVLLYQKLGLGNKPFIKNSIMKFVKKNYNNLSQQQREQFKDFVINGPQNSLENKVVSGLFGIITLAGLYFGISGISGTGAAIGITNSSSGFLGILLFVSGIAGLFFSRK